MSESNPTQSVGTVWEIPSKTEVDVIRPDGSSVHVVSDGKTAHYVLDVPGTHAAGARSMEAK